MRYRPTDEQQGVLEKAATGESLKVNAYAGAGKTSTLDMVARAKKKNSERGFYVAFNKTVADEAQASFPSNVRSKTAHSLAFREVGSEFSGRLFNMGRLTGRMVADTMGLKFTYDVPPISLGYMVLDMMGRYANSADEKVDARHGSMSATMLLLKGMNRNRKNARDLISAMVPITQKFWEHLIKKDTKLPITHDTYLKLWGLGEPKIETDFIMFDEAQDASGVMLDVVQRQDAQTIWVGDKYQAIYGWRGAVNAMEKIKTDHECILSQSFRFGQTIADIAHGVLNEMLSTDIKIRGFEEAQSVVSPCSTPSAILCRTNAGLIDELMACTEENVESVYVEGGVSNLLNLVEGVQDLKKGKRSTHADLRGFKNFDDLQEYVDSGYGQDLAVLMNILEAHGDYKLHSTLSRYKGVRKESASRTLSTAHKAKGLEWDSVRLSDDFPTLSSEGDLAPAETYLLYVAATRARKHLDISRCSTINHVLYGVPEELEDDNHFGFR